MGLRAIATLTALLVAPPLQAQPADRGPARPLKPSETLFWQGRALMEHEDYRAACAKFAESLRLERAAGTLLNLATCEDKLGQLVSAERHWREAIALLPAGDNRLRFARERAEQVGRRIPRLTVRWAADAPPDTRVELDGMVLDAASLAAPVPVDPGTHLLTVTASGHAPSRLTVALAEGEQKDLQAGPGPANPSHEAAPAPAEARPSRKGLLPWVVGGGGIAFATGGAVLLALVASDFGELERTCMHDCSRSSVDDLETRANLSYVLLGIGGAAVATGVVLWLLEPRAGSAGRRAWIAPAPNGLVAGGIF